MSDDPRYYRLSAAEEAALWAARLAEDGRRAELKAEADAEEARQAAKTAAWEAANAEWYHPDAIAAREHITMENA